jgi:hypothetical protein
MQLPFLAWFQELILAENEFHYQQHILEIQDSASFFVQPIPLASDFTAFP